MPNNILVRSSLYGEITVSQSTLFMSKPEEARVDLKVPPAMKAEWEIEAKDCGLSLSAWVRVTLNEAVLNGRANRAKLRREAHDQPIKPKR